MQSLSVCLSLFAFVTERRGERGCRDQPLGHNPTRVSVALRPTALGKLRGSRLPEPASEDLPLAGILQRLISTSCRRQWVQSSLTDAKWTPRSGYA